MGFPHPAELLCNILFFTHGSRTNESWLNLELLEQMQSDAWPFQGCPVCNLEVKGVFRQ